MASDSRNQVQTTRRKLRALRWRKLFAVLGLNADEQLARAEVQQAVQSIDSINFDYFLNEKY